MYFIRFVSSMAIDNTAILNSVVLPISHNRDLQIQEVFIAIRPVIQTQPNNMERASAFVSTSPAGPRAVRPRVAGAVATKLCTVATSSLT